MKPNSLTRIALLTSILAIGAACTARAQDNTTPSGAGGTVSQDATTPTTPPGGGGWHHHHMDKVLTPAELAELKKDREQVFASNPDLKKAEDDLRSQRPARDASEADKKAYFEKMKAQQENVKAAILAIDPAAQAIFDKLEAAHKAHQKGDDGGNGGQ